MARVPGIADRRTPESHDRITDELVERATVAEYHFDLPAEVTVQQIDDEFRRMAFRQRGEAADIRKQHRDLARFGLAGRVDPAAFDEAPDHARIEKWRFVQALRRTVLRRPDLIEARGGLSDKEKTLLEGAEDVSYPSLFADEAP